MRQPNTTPNEDLTQEITDLLNRWEAGDDPRMEALIPRIYDNLCALARRHLKGENRGTFLQTQALVNEVYLQLERSHGFHFESREQFFAWVSKVMRHLLIRMARRKHTRKRGARQQKLSLDSEQDQPQKTGADPTRLLSLHEALDRLAQQDSRAARVVELKFFGGLQSREIGRVLGISKTTVARDWEFARYWLSRELGSKNQDMAAI